MAGENAGSYKELAAQREYEKRGDIKEYIEAELSKDLSEERKAEMTKEIGVVADFIQGANIDFAIAGGSGLDLIDGEWSRDHHDVDAIISSLDKLKFFDAAIADGYVLTDPSRKKLDKESVLDESLHNAFLYRSDDRGISEFEIMFLTETEDGIVLEDGVLVSVEEYRSMAPRAQIGERDIALQPTEVILFYKITDGRRKDLQDIKNYWKSLDNTQKSRVQEWVSASGTTFELSDIQTNNVEELLRSADWEETVRSDQFFAHAAARIEKAVMGDFGEVLQTLWMIRQNTKTRDEFLQNTSEQYGEFAPERATIVEQIADRLFSDEAIDFDSFATWSRELVDVDSRIMPMALHEYVNEKIWLVSSQTNETA